MSRSARRLISAGTLLLTLPLFAQDSGAAQAAERLDESNRRMLWLAFGLYALVVTVYLVWSDLRLRRLERDAARR